MLLNYFGSADKVFGCKESNPGWGKEVLGWLRELCVMQGVGLRDIADASPHRWAEEGSYASRYIKLGRVSLAETP